MRTLESANSVTKNQIVVISVSSCHLFKMLLVYHVRLLADYRNACKSWCGVLVRRILTVQDFFAAPSTEFNQSWLPLFWPQVFVTSLSRWCMLNKRITPFRPLENSIFPQVFELAHICIAFSWLRHYSTIIVRSWLASCRRSVLLCYLSKSGKAMRPSSLRKHEKGSSRTDRQERNQCFTGWQFCTWCFVSLFCFNPVCGELITRPRNPSAWSRNLTVRRPRPGNGLLCHWIIIIII
jgi:hypothetical protein